MYNVVITKTTPSDVRFDYNHDALDEELNEAPEAPREYAFSCIVRHTGKCTSVKYVIRFHGYTTADDTFESPHNIPQHLISYYWHRVQREGAVRCSTRCNDKIRQWKKGEKMELNLLMVCGFLKISNCI